MSEPQQEFQAAAIEPDHHCVCYSQWQRDQCKHWNWCCGPKDMPNPRVDPFAARCADLARKGTPGFDTKDYE